MRASTWKPASAAIVAIALVTQLVAACAPASAPAPTAAPSKPAPAAEKPAPPPATQAAAPEKPSAQPTAQMAEKPTAVAKPAYDEQAVANFYRGKSLRVIVGLSPGGGFDTLARIVARHMPRYIPGNPTMVVENMTGAGSMIAANHLYNVAPKDGTVIGSVNEALVFSQLLGQDGVEFDMAKFSWLGSAVKVFDTCAASADSGVRSIKDIIGTDKELIVGGTAPGSSSDDIPRLLSATVGAKFKLVSGYEGSNNIRLAMESGEVQGGCWSWDNMSSTPEWFEGSSAPYRLIVAFTDTRSDHPLLRDVPTAMELATTDEARGLIRMAMAPFKIGKPYLAPPETDPQRLAALRQAFDKTFADPQFQVEAKQAKQILDASTHAEVLEVVRAALDQPADRKTKLKTILGM